MSRTDIILAALTISRRSRHVEKRNDVVAHVGRQLRKAVAEKALLSVRYELAQQYLTALQSHETRRALARRAKPVRRTTQARFTNYIVYTYRPGRYDVAVQTRSRVQAERSARALSKTWPGIAVCGVRKQDGAWIVLTRYGLIPTNLQTTLQQA